MENNGKGKEGTSKNGSVFPKKDKKSVKAMAVEKIVKATTSSFKNDKKKINPSDTIEKILKAITTLCTKVDSMDNEIQKQTNEDNLKSKASISQQHDYKNAELCRSKRQKKSRAKR
ncbi:hypothetical protein H5410_023286 [Solanum commersonii]|uniref:Uncharacterized protein n=1 Tax=Solanum commersonii TaxID=4109 RepID=A0A9J5ZHV0_SOLCO|nr:hypothetical protein H5410_023286 [Solanum commersonii]